MVGFNPSGEPNPIPVDERWRAFYANVLLGGLGSFVGVGRSATLWRTLDASRVSEYDARRMTEPPPIGTVRHAGDVVMLPITGGPQPLPATYWSANGLPPSDSGALNPAYCIAMGQTAQAHFLQECVGVDTIRIWAAFVEDVEINLQTEFVELFPYAEFDVSDCGMYDREDEPPLNRKVYAYCPARRVKPFTPSVPLSALEEGSEQFKGLFG